MEKYNTSTFKSLLTGDLSDQETAALWQDPTFEQEFAFYLQMKQAGQQLIEKYSTADTDVVEQEDRTPKEMPLSSKLAMAASVALVLLGGYMLVPSSDTLMGNQPSFLEQYGLGLGLVAVGAFGLYFFRKR